MEKRLNRPPWRQNLKEKARCAKNDYPSPYLRIVEPLMERLDSWASGYISFESTRAVWKSLSRGIAIRSHGGEIKR